MGDDEDGKARVEVKVRDLRQSRPALGGKASYSVDSLDGVDRVIVQNMIARSDKRRSSHHVRVDHCQSED